MRISDWSSDVCSSDLIGTTMEAVAEALLNHRRLTVVTNHLTVATILNCKREFQVILAGGLLKHNDQATTGEATREFLEKFRVGYGIFGIGGVSEDGDLLEDRKSTRLNSSH